MSQKWREKKWWLSPSTSTLITLLSCGSCIRTPITREAIKQPGEVTRTSIAAEWWMEAGRLSLVARRLFASDLRAFLQFVDFAISHFHVEERSCEMALYDIHVPNILKPWGHNKRRGSLPTPKEWMMNEWRTSNSNILDSLSIHPSDANGGGEHHTIPSFPVDDAIDVL